MKKIIFAVLFFNCYTDSFSQKSPFEQLHAEIQPQDLKKDMDTWIDWLQSIHPDLSYTIKDIDQFYQMVAQIKDSIYSPLTVLEFWKRISVLNSQLSDGHLIVGHINAPIVMNYLKNGGTFFPFEVVFNKNELFISSN